MNRPRIGITGVSRNWDGQPRTGVNAAYVRAVLQAGGLPVILPPELDAAGAVELFGECDGLLLTGGEDVSPDCYHAAPHAELGTVDPRRDANEIALVADARARDIPVLGICRGLQLCNVAFGGTLFQHIPTDIPGALDHDPAGARNARSHAVIVTDGSRLAGIVESTALDVNSFHHQAVDRLGECLTVTARAPDGTVEAIESTDSGDWIVAVQWHPEELAGDENSPDARLFAALVQAARRA